MGKKLANATFVPASEDPDNPYEGRWYQAGEEVDGPGADKLGDHVWESDETDDDEDGNAVLRQSNVPLRELKRIADELGVEYPKNVGHEALTQAIRFAQGRQTSGEPVGTTPDTKEQVESVFTDEAWTPPAKDLDKNKATSARKATDTNDAAGR
jgi:hypothetical protein